MKVYMENYGCPVNKADGAYMLSLLYKAGFNEAKSPDEADIIIINTCTVRKDTENNMVKRIRKLYALASRKGAKLIVAGCLPKAQPYLVNTVAPNASMVSPQNYDRIVDVALSKSRVVLLKGERRTDIVPMYVNGVVAAIPIAEGCLGNCSYCIVKLARGNLKSYPPRLIIERVKQALAKGVVEIDLTAQDTAAYGLDIGTNLAELVSEITEINGDFMVRIGMMNPNLALKMLDELLEIYKHPKVYKFLHIPLQSGDNRVLKIMNRPYTVEEFKEIVREFRRKIPEINITTDIIVGHPGEDEKAFENTLKIMREIGFDRIHLAIYSLRPHTLSASMPQIPSAVKKARMKRAIKVMEKEAYKKHSRFIGRKVNVLVTETGRNNTLVGRTINYYPVILPPTESIMGLWVKVEITDATFYDLRGKVIKVLGRRKLPHSIAKCKVTVTT
ncbi:MAG: tRNA (N(6)-L-threonylcarbamoyladenosine(37)-C(2))-methylthiotransferase [Thermoprotei archaeon]|nr:tRNA (N(6)-L-threonylcarbamoyladenosine(37)-C(2))-methylthiotransferase [Thermoprotei archaeon]